MVFADFEAEDTSIPTSELNIKQEIQSELERVRLVRYETSRKIQQSQAEVAKLAKRNATITSQLQQAQSQLGMISKEDLKAAYDAALETQQRLFIMRGQLEKLQEEESVMGREVELLQKVMDYLEQPDSQSAGAGSSFANIEMMIQAQEDERQHLSRQMHDGPAQALSNFILQTEIATRLFDVDQSRAREELVNLKGAASSTFQKIREFIFELRPMMLDDLGVLPTIRRYVDAVRDQAGMDIQLSINGSERRLESYQEVVIFRSIQELLRNAITHSQGSEIKLSIELPENEIRVSVEDNGKGFDPAAVQREKSMGLRVIKERVEMLKGDFDLDSSPGNGTRVFFRLPVTKNLAAL